MLMGLVKLRNLAGEKKVADDNSRKLNVKATHTKSPTIRTNCTSELSLITPRKWNPTPNTKLEWQNNEYTETLFVRNEARCLAPVHIVFYLQGRNVAN